MEQLTCSKFLDAASMKSRFFNLFILFELLSLNFIVVGYIDIPL